MHDPYAALRHRNFRLYLTGNLVALLGMQMQSVAILWEIYERTNDTLALGLVGLTQVAPVLALALVAGHIVDSYDRKRVLSWSLALSVTSSAGLALISLTSAPVPALYGCLFAHGVGRAFRQPAKSAILPRIVPPEDFPNAVAWATTSFQLVAIAGPALGGVLIALTHSPALVYILDGLGTLWFLLLLRGVTHRPHDTPPDSITLRGLLAGIGFLKHNQVLLGALTLDMFAVLFGGAVTLFPVYAKDILQVGATGLGWMQAAPAVGACLMGAYLAHRPPIQKAGRTLLLVVAAFGSATILFGLSRSFPLSLLSLLLLGVFDQVSVVIRHTLVQTLTPDSMRGRVSALNGMFIGASNELGGFESGTVAWLFSPTFSVVSGGLGTLAVVLLAACFWPNLRRYGSLASIPPQPVPEDP